MGRSLKRDDIAELERDIKGKYHPWLKVLVNNIMTSNFPSGTLYSCIEGVLFNMSRCILISW